MPKMKIYAIILATAVCMTAFAQERKEPLWNYAVPGADVILYVNTKQPEINMDKALWQRIKRDKEQAIAQNAEEQFFDTKDRDMELLANLFIRSVSPFSCSIEGVANISGNIKNDLAKLLNSLKDNGGSSPQITKQQGLDLYNFSIAGTQDTPPIDIMLVPVDNNIVQFKINIVPQGKMIQTTLSPSGKTSPAIAKLRAQEPAFAVFCRTDKLSTFSLPVTPNAQKLQAFLTKITELSVSGVVRGTDLVVGADIVFKTSEEAGVFHNSIQSVLPQIGSMMNARNVPASAVLQNCVHLSVNVNIADAWNLISKITSSKKQERCNND